MKLTQKILTTGLMLAGLSGLTGCKFMLVPYIRTDNPIYSRDDAIKEYLERRRQRKKLYQGIEQQDKSVNED